MWLIFITIKNTDIRVTHHTVVDTLHVINVVVTKIMHNFMQLTPKQTL